MTSHPTPEDQLRAENAKLLAQLEEAEETLRAIRMGEVDSLVVETADGPQIFSLNTAEAASDRFRGEILAQVGDAVIAVDCEGFITFFNAAAERIYGVRSNQVLGRKLSEIYTRQWSCPAAEAAMWNALQEHSESIQRLHDGGMLDVESSVAQSRGAYGADAGMVAANREITERKKAEEALRASEERYRILYDALPVAAFVCNHEAMIQNYNSRAVELWGREPMVGVEKHCGSMKLILPDGVVLPHAQSPMMEVLRTGNACRNVEVSIERPDGSRIPVLVNFCALRNGEGTIVGVVTSFDDITARKQAEEALRESQEFFHTMTDAMPQLAWMAQPDGAITWYNQRWYEYTETTQQEMEGWGWQSVHDPGVLPQVLERWRSSIATGEPFEMTFPLRGADGVFRPFLTRVMPQKDQQGRVLNWFGTNTDVDVLKRAEKALRESENRKSAILEGALDAIITMDHEGKIADFNPAAEKTFGHHYEEAVGQPLAELIIPERFRQRHNEGVARYLATGHGPVLGQRIEMPSLHAKGHEFPSELSISRIAGLEPPMFTATLRDITERKEAEEALRKSREFTRRVLDNLYSFVGVLEVDGTLIEVNRAPLEGAGVSSSEVLGKKFWDCFWWSYSPEVQARLRAACERACTGELVRYDELVRMAGETTIWIDFQISPLRDGEGRVTHLIPSGMDISERKRGEETLRQNSEVFVRLVDQAPTGMYVIDADFRLQQVNALAEPVFAKVDRLIGRDFAEVMEIIWGREVGAEVVRIFRHTLDTGERYVSPSFTHERQDIGGEQAYEWQTQRVSLADGRYGVVCYFEDVTERQRVERTIRESETRTRLATEATAVGIWEWNVLTNEVRWDAQLFRIYGMVPTVDGNVQYSDWSAAVLPEDLAETERILLETVRCGGESRREFRIRRRSDGEVRDIEGVETMRIHELGPAKWVVGTNLDITERKQSRAALLKAKEHAEAASRAKDDFLAALSHELRTPLNPVLMTLTSLAGDPSLPPEALAQLDMMRRNIELEARLIDDLLDITRISHGKLIMVRITTDVHELLNHTDEIVRSDSLGKQLHVVLKLDAACHHALVDPARLQQVFWNLLRNAVKFTPDGGTITVSTRNDIEGRITISVSDCGIGIRPEVLAKIFNAFEQGDTSGEPRYGGLGLGLAISSAIVTAHGGEIKAESEGTGHGANFIVTLNSAAAPATTGEIKPSQDRPVRKLSLLIVEDHEASRMVLEHLLTRSGHRVTTAGTVHDALSAFKAAHFDVVISDLGLPDGTGFDLMVQIQSIRSIPAIALSGYGMESDLRRTREAGFSAHLVKPVKVDQLKKLLADI